MLLVLIIRIPETRVAVPVIRIPIIGEREASTRRLLFPLSCLQQLGCYLRGIHRNAGELRMHRRVALDDQFVLWVLDRISHPFPLLLTDEDQVVRRLRGRGWQALG